MLASFDACYSVMKYGKVLQQAVPGSLLGMSSRRGFCVQYALWQRQLSRECFVALGKSLTGIGH